MDYYEVLGLNKNASKAEIKEAFRKMVMQFHRDKHSFSAKLVKEGATLRFKHVSEAYEVLIDDRKRADYNFHCSCPGAGGFSSRYSYGYGILLGGTVIIDMSREALWKMQNPGKPFEEAMESIEKAKSVDDNSLKGLLFLIFLPLLLLGCPNLRSHLVAPTK